MGGYILNKEGISRETERKLYRTGELELMTTHQLREICRRERIIQGILNPLDKEELVSVIMRCRGTRERLLIRKESEEGIRVLEQMFAGRRIVPVQDRTLHIPSKLIVYEGLSMGAEDRVRIPYRRELADTNALLVSGGKEVCGIFHLQAVAGEKGWLYVVREEGMPCREADLKEYDLYCFRQQDSDRIFALYYGTGGDMPERIQAYRIPLMDVEVRSPVELRMPLAIDFGSASTTAGVCLDSRYFEETRGVPFAEDFEKNAVQYTTFSGGSRLMPSVAGVVTIEHGEPRFVFGQEAADLSGASYVDEGFSVFYDMKRWISDPDREEEITDREGRRTFLPRREIIRAFILYIIRTTENRFKCRVRQIHVSCPVRQKFLFQKLFHRILPEYMPQDGEMLDEGVAVLYSTISGMLGSGKLEEDTEYQALVIDCGGGTTDLCACRFRYRDDRVAYHIRIETAYENGDTDFGGDNLTYRIMQYIKIRMAEKLGFRMPVSAEEILQGLDVDTFRYVDASGTSELYRGFEAAYETAEQYLPTRFKEYEARSRSDYFKVKNNFYHLFSLAEEVKKRFYDRAGILRVGISSGVHGDSDISWVQADKWKLSVQENGVFRVVKEFPEIIVNLYEAGLVIKGDIYGIIRKLMEPLYKEDRIRDFSFLRLTGQSCRIDLFREALKEFIPGRMIQFRHGGRGTAGDTDLKMGCVDGALKYIRDKRLGYAQVELYSDEPLLPYTVSAHTHNGREVELVNGFLRGEETRYVSRNLEDLTLYLYLKDTGGRERYRFCLDCDPKRFREVTYEGIREAHGTHIAQKETDSIADGEIRFFAWKRCADWGFVVVPVYRKYGRLYLGDGQFYPFEHESWTQNLYDGTK